MSEPQHISEILPGVMEDIQRRRVCEFSERILERGRRGLRVNTAGADTRKKGFLSDKTIVSRAGIEYQL